MKRIGKAGIVSSGNRSIHAASGEVQNTSTEEPEAKFHQAFEDLLNKKPRRNPLPRLTIEQILEKIDEASKRRALHTKAYRESGNKDFLQYISAMMEGRELEALAELLAYRVWERSKEGGPGLDGTDFRVGGDPKYYEKHVKIWRKKRRDEGKPVLPKFHTPEHLIYF